MTKNEIRNYVLLAFVLITYLLHAAWQESTLPKKTESAVVKQELVRQEHLSSAESVSQTMPRVDANGKVQKEPRENTNTRLVEATSDVLQIKINLDGGDLVFAKLLKYNSDLEGAPEALVLLDNKYFVQSGILNEHGPDFNGKRAVYQTEKPSYAMSALDGRIDIKLKWTNSENNLVVYKVYTLQRNNYAIAVNYIIENHSAEAFVGNLFGQIKKYNENIGSSKIPGAQMYNGAAVYTIDKPYKKISFSDIKAEAFQQQVHGGWVAMVKRYFLTAWVADPVAEQSYFTRADKDVDGTDIYNVGMIQKITVPAHSQATFAAKIYAGPEKIEDLKQLAKGLELTVDYGFLWPVAEALLWALKKIYLLVNNWGVAILLLTLLIKGLFVGLSAKSYRSMAKLKQLQPKLEILKARYQDDKQKLGQETLELYKKEKVNPVSGCLPILVQIPVFFALYCVLLESIELRHAPFIWWIQDLSARDPYYILPIIMAISMYVQQKLSPPPADPIQAKVFAFMPLVMSLLFMQFASGLVLYWAFNSILSNIQQWYIMRTFAREA